MPERSHSSRRFLRLGLLALGLGVMIWQTGPQRSVCLIDPIGAFGGPGEGEAPLSQVVATASESEPRKVLVAAVAPESAKARPSALWSFTAAPANAVELEHRAPARTSAVHYVEVDRNLLSGKSAVIWQAGEQLILPLPDGREVGVTIDSTEARGPDRFVVSGRIDGVAGSRFLLSVSDQHVAASIEGLAPAEFQLHSIGAADEPIVQLFALDEPGDQTCNTVLPGFDLEGQALAALAARNGATPPTANTEVLTSGDAVVDLLVAYTDAVTASFGSTNSVMTQIDLSVAKVQSDFANSGVTARIRLVGTVEVELPGDSSTAGQSGWQNTALQQVTATQDGVMDVVHARRDALGADLVTLVVRRTDPRSTGIAYLFQGLESTTAPFFAFSVINAADFSVGVVMSHELGHSFGCAHDRQNAGNSGLFDYSHGYRVTAATASGGARQVRTIMAYAPGTRVRYFSNPEKSITSSTSTSGTLTFAAPLVLGVPEGQSDEANNVSTIEQTAFQVANFRLSADQSDAGRLVNVSTRAWVGSGDRALIGGFVLGGENTKQVLVRAPGPAIGAAPFNVPTVLVDPVLRIDRIGDGTIAINNDWGSPATNGIAVATAATAAGAFAFSTGSLDAGTVVELAPGSYTATVEGAGGAEGNGLIEVYEIGTSGSPRLLNLSTRGYADVEQPMIAGFVVSADPGASDQRKSIFIRVRGPSLTNYGLAEASVMSDPIIEIYDANAQLVFYNDDWDPPSTDIDGTNRDGIPLLLRGMVDQLSEQVVFNAATAVGATDMEPTEPGVVLELPAGIYTVFVRPFEQLPNQPAEPGIAIVEVFEVDL